MHILVPIFAASVLVFFGYFALWSAAQATTPKGISSFGRILAIILFVMAGLALVSPVAARHFHRGGMMQNAACCCPKPGFMGGSNGQWMHRMPMQCNPTQAAPTPENKPEAPASK